MFFTLVWIKSMNLVAFTKPNKQEAVGKIFVQLG